MMQRLLPASVLGTVADGIELGALTHALDLRMAEALQRLAPTRKRLDADLYSRAYREVGHARLRDHQIDLISAVGLGLARAVRTPGVSMLLRLSRGPAKASGLGELQGFLERGFAAFAALGDGKAFVDDIEASEREVAQRLFSADPDPVSYTHLDVYKRQLLGDDLVDIIQGAAQARGGLGHAWCHDIKAIQQRAVAVVDDVIAQADAMRGQHGAQHVGAQAQVGKCVAVSELADAMACGKTEEVGEEKFAVPCIGFKHQLVDIGELVRVFLHAYLHA